MVGITLSVSGTDTVTTGGTKRMKLTYLLQSEMRYMYLHGRVLEPAKYHIVNIMGYDHTPLSAKEIHDHC